MNKIYKIVTVVLLSTLGVNALYAQAPNLGSAANFVLFTNVGAITNTGITYICNWQCRKQYRSSHRLWQCKWRDA
jgi:hypothetical protein